MIEFKACRKCHHTKGPVPEGYYMEERLNPRTSIKVPVMIECEHHRIWRIKKSAEKKFIDNGFNKDFYDYDIANYKGNESISNVNRLIKYVHLFDNKDENIKRQAIKSVIYLYGPNGTQKTTLANWIGSELLQKGVSCCYALMKKIIDELWESQRDEEAKAYIDKLLKCDVLIIDEAFSKDKIHLWQSGNQIGYIDEFLREKLNNGKGIIFISNNSPSEIESQGFSHSIHDLVNRELLKTDGTMKMTDKYFDNIGQIPESLF